MISKRIPDDMGVQILHEISQINVVFSYIFFLKLSQIIRCSNFRFSSSSKTDGILAASLII